MLRRNDRGPFGGMWVFPGGKIDPADAAPQDGGPGADGKGDPAEAAEITAARRAAVREAQEEAKLVLDPATLVVQAWWMPPLEAPRRFATWFFLAPADAAPEVEVDGAEIYEHRWFTPAEAHAARDRGEVRLAPPTWMTLAWLRGFDGVAAALDAAQTRPFRRFETRMRQVDDGLVAAWAGDAAYESWDLDAPGGRHRLWMGKGPWRAEIHST